jgi:xanthine/uracil permease
MMSMEGEVTDRSSEWFVPKFGPPKFRVMVGLLFIPYTAMVLAFSVIGSMLARLIHWDRVLCIVVIYLLGLGISAHALDAAGSKGQKPWGRVFTKPQLWFLAILSLVAAYLIAVYFMVLYVPWLSLVAVLEGFFVFAYNLEWFHGKFHTDGWFAFSWGFLPVLAGYIMQTNGISPEALILALSMALLSVVEIKASRPYKALKGRPDVLGEEELGAMRGYEAMLKSISLGVVLLAAGLVVWRLFA